jgi:nucleoside-diphosphate-sugar epimerase
MKILVTGGKGFVGQATIPPWIDYQQSGPHQWSSFDVMDNADIRDKDQFAKAVEAIKPNRILHLAAVARFADADSDPVKAFETNVIGTKNVTEVASERHIPLVYASTGSVYMPIKEKPPITEEFSACGNSVYGCTKYAGELYVKQSKSPWIILRYSHLYGREKRMHGLIGGFLARIQRGLAPVLMGGKQSNDFCYITDISRANVLALEAPWDKWNQVYNIGTGEELSAEDAGKAVCEVFGYKGKIELREQRTVDPDRFVYNCSKAESMLGFKSKYSFREGLLDMKSQMDAVEADKFVKAA